jgi:hypothetical protein
MSVPVFLHVLVNGDLWISNNLSDTPAGTAAGVFRLLDDCCLTKIGTISGNSPSYSVSGSNGKQGRDLGGR